MRYPIVIHKDSESGYGVTVPDLPGCFSAGDTLDEAINSAQEAIECHIEGMLMDNEEIPQPTEIDEQAYQGGTWALVAVDISKLGGKTRRINITVPENLLNQFDGFVAKNEGEESRSGLFVNAALEYIQKRSA